MYWPYDDDAEIIVIKNGDSICKKILNSKFIQKISIDSQLCSKYWGYHAKQTFLRFWCQKVYNLFAKKETYIENSSDDSGHLYFVFCCGAACCSLRLHSWLIPSHLWAAAKTTLLSEGLSDTSKQVQMLPLCSPIAPTLSLVSFYGYWWFNYLFPDRL